MNSRYPVRTSALLGSALTVMLAAAMFAIHSAYAADSVEDQVPCSIQVDCHHLVYLDVESGGGGVDWYHAGWLTPYGYTTNIDLGGNLLAGCDTNLYPSTQWSAGESGVNSLDLFGNGYAPPSSWCVYGVLAELEATSWFTLGGAQLDVDELQDFSS